MKIHIQSANDTQHDVNFSLPTRAVLSSLTATIAAGAAKKHVSATPHQLRRLFRVIRESRKVLGDLPLVEVISNDGDYVRIDL